MAHKKRYREERRYCRVCGAELKNEEKARYCLGCVQIMKDISDVLSVENEPASMRERHVFSICK